MVIFSGLDISLPPDWAIQLCGDGWDGYWMLNLETVIQFSFCEMNRLSCLHWFEFISFDLVLSGVSSGFDTVHSGHYNVTKPPSTKSPLTVNENDCSFAQQIYVEQKHKLMAHALSNKA